MNLELTAAFRSTANPIKTQRSLTDIKNPRLIYLKGLLFLFGGCLAAGLLLSFNPSFKIALLLAISVWCFARFYYFAFYVIQHYVDDRYRFAGLLPFFAYMLRQRFGWKPTPDDDLPPV